MPLTNLSSEIRSEREKRNLAILGAVRRYGPITKPEISQAVGLNIVTVSNYIEEFLNHNLIFEKEFDISAGGRRPMLLDINPDAGTVIGVGLNLMNIVGVQTDLKGRIVARSSLEHNSPSIKEIVRCVSEIIHSILKKSGAGKEKIKGIGIGIAGLVNKKDGSVHWPEKVEDTYDYVSVYVPLKDVLERDFGLPVLIENDATAACFGEQWMGLKTEVKNLVYMFSGVGCGMIFNGEIYTGSSGLAGEVSIHNPKNKPEFNCSAGAPCFLKRWEIDFGIVEEAHSKILKLKNSGESDSAAKRLLELANGKIEDINLKMIFQAAREHDSFALELLNRAAMQLGIRAAHLVNLLNPEMVLIGGGLEQAGDVFLNGVRSMVNEWAFQEVSKNVRILYSDLGENAVALGAASLVMRQIFAQI